jgi:hypothetical protein
VAIMAFFHIIHEFISEKLAYVSKFYHKTFQELAVCVGSVTLVQGHCAVLTGVRRWGDMMLIINS